MRGKLLKLTLLLLTFSTQKASSIVPPGKPLLQSWGIAEYRGHQQNWAIQHGADGLIYVGGGSSLLVFDGANWRQIETPDEGRVRDLEIDPQGRVWVAIPNQFGFFERDALGQLQYQSISDRLPEEQRDFGETRLVRRIDEVIYFNTLNHLYRWADGELTSFDKWDGVFRLTFVAQGRYYAAVGNRLYDFTEFPADGSPPDPEPRWRWPDKAKITFLHEWGQNQILLGTYDDGLYLLSGDQPQRFANQPALRDAWPYDAYRLPDDSLMVSTIRSGFFHLDSSGQLLEHIGTAQGLPVNTVLDATMDPLGGLWVALEGAVSRVELNASLRVFDQDIDVVNTRALIEHQGQLFTSGNTTLATLGVSDDGLTTLTELEVPVMQEGFDLVSTNEGLLVAGFDGVYQVTLDQQGTSVVDAKQLHDDSYAYDLFPSPTRPAIYVESEHGVTALIRSAGGWRGLPVVDGIVERPSTIAEDTQGRVWVGTGAGRIHQLAWRDDESLELVRTLGAEQGVPPGNAHVYRIGDRLIVGTTLGGYRLTANAMQIEPDPLFGNDQLGDQRDLFRLIEGGDGKLAALIGGDKALWRGQLRSDGSIQWSGPHLRQLGAGDANFLTEAMGQLWLGHNARVLTLDWPEANTEPVTPATLNLRWAGFPDRPEGSDRLLLAGNADAAAPLSEPLAHSQDQLRFEYALTSYARPEKTQYRVWLQGHDNGWSQWSHETRRDYTNLGGGDYQFRVQARDVFGAVSESTPYPFSVQPPWYLSRAAWLGYIGGGLLLLALAALFGQRFRQRRMLATQRQLEQEVAERTREVRHQARELRKLNEAKSRFFANVSHEFRTPLTLAKGPLEELATGEAGPLSDEAKRYVGMALRNTEAMQGLIGQILDINRLEAGRMPISVTHDDFAMLVRGIVEEFSEQAKQQGIEFSCHGCASPLMADFDPGHMGKVVRNLVANALKFTPSGGQVQIVCQADAGHIELQVIDTGCGIDETDLSRIFERYFQGDQTHASQPGTGIGLALVRELIELHQGQVTAHSAVDEGATFTVRFPTALPELATSPIEAANDEVVEPTASASLWQIETDADDVPSILIVDDNAELRAFLNMRLCGSYRVLEASDGEQGLAMAKAELPDIVVTDVMMPKMTGLEMTSALKTDAATDFIPILMLSARTTRRDTVEGLERGADDYLAKPFDSAELATRVAGLIASRRKLRQRLKNQALSSSNESPFLKKAHSMVVEHLADPDFGPRDWANLLHMDRTTLYRKLKAETEQSPEAYLREQRLQRAAELLKTNAGNVSQVAVAVGFNSISYFSKRFKERFGVTPAAYTKR